MFCPYCNNSETVVKDSRISEDGFAIRRRRHCTKCDSRFTTFERIQTKELIIVKKNGEKQFFDRDKLARSIKMAIRKRPVDLHKSEEIVNDIIRELETSQQSEIKSSILGEIIMSKLAKLDPVALVRFASVYKNFSSAKDFKEFIAQLKN